MINQDLIDLTKKFVQSRFQEFPHFSFNDWTVMTDHSFKVMEYAVQIAQTVPEVDLTVVAISALLHDIGKTHQASPETLHKKHQDFNWQVSEEFLRGLDLPTEQLEQIKQIISYQSDSIETEIIKDADALAFCADPRLYMLWYEWVIANSLESEVDRKLAKYDYLNFEISSHLQGNLVTSMKEPWDEYQHRN